MSDDALSPFHPLIGQWFDETVGSPTQVQRLAWPRIAAGEHVLATAPTGSGKTLAAFLGALDRLIRGDWPLGAVRVLYVSPLRALNNDVQRNLLRPLGELTEVFAAAGEPMPAIRVLTRSGDTPTNERQRMARKPPEILITTPESLNILLTSKRGRAMLDGLASVVLDEVHAVAGSKRGVHLVTALERLALLGGEFQRVALSATVEPPERIARWVGGRELRRHAGHTSFHPREVALVRSTEPKDYDFKVRMAGPTANDRGEFDTIWPYLADELRGTIKANRSTLVFTNSKRKVEFVARLLNDGEPEELVWSHHGALSRELRAVVEQRLKDGELAGIIATNSLELGIDIGALDEVALLQTPPSIASTLQRIGRAGHGVGETSVGRLYPLYPVDLLLAAVVARSVMAGEIEPIQPIRGALDVLAQVLLSMVASEEWETDALYDAIRTAEPYADLSRTHFDLVLDMLAGRYATTRVREMRPLVSYDRVRGTVRARPGSERLVYMSGGTIPDRGYYHLRRTGSMAKIGELDEEFVWERTVGDTFTLGVQTWRVDRITHNDVMVTPANSAASMAPFWRADERDRRGFLSERLSTFLEDADGRLADDDFRDELLTECHLEEPAADALLTLLRAQKKLGGGHLPHRHHLVVERIAESDGRSADDQVVLHTLWGGRVNRPFATALQAAWLQQHGSTLDVMHDDECLILRLPGGVRGKDLLAMVDVDDLDRLLRSQLELTGFFGGRFRENAGRAMLLPRQGFRHRTPLWVTRQRSKELLEAVSKHEDFPIVLETWRTCLQDVFELDRLRGLLDEVRAGEIRVREVTTSSPSPFAGNVVWKQTSDLMYADDVPLGGKPTGLKADLVRELVFSPNLRPRIPAAIVEQFTAKLQRTWPGYAPRAARDLLDWVVERVVLGVREWDALLAAMQRDHDLEIGEAVAEVADRLVTIRGVGDVDLVCALETLPRLAAALGVPAADLDVLCPGAAGPAIAPSRLPPYDPPDGEDPTAALVAEVLRFHGPVDPGLPGSLLGLGPRLDAVLDDLQATQDVVVDLLTDGVDSPQLCDAGNLERLLRIARAAARPSFEPRPLVELPLFLAARQGVGGTRSGVDGLRRAMEPLFGHVAPADLWETDLLPVRVQDYDPAWLDALLGESDLTWLGCGSKKLAFTLAGDRDLLADVDGAGGDPSDGPGDDVLPAGPGRFTLTDLAASSPLGSAELTRQLWELAWAGQVSNDGFAAVRKALEAGFEPKDIDHPKRGRRSGRGRFGRWQASRPFAGSWFRLPPVEPPRDALDAEELRRDRVRLLLDRHGVLFRELVTRELPALRWGTLFRTLRLMELSGEVLTGQFFLDVPGVQFISHAALRDLQQGLDPDRIWWLTAADPASPCGLGLPLELPRRVPSNHLVFHGPELVIVSQRRARALEIRVPPDHPRLGDYLGVFDAWLARGVRPLRSVTVEQINGDPAGDSPFRPILAERFHVTGDRGMLHVGVRF
jgi:ATP-dependent helicase Lhr and Lhr-like helicase